MTCRQWHQFVMSEESQRQVFLQTVKVMCYPLDPDPVFLIIPQVYPIVLLAFKPMEAVPLFCLSSLNITCAPLKMGITLLSSLNLFSLPGLH